MEKILFRLFLLFLFSFLYSFISPVSALADNSYQCTNYTLPVTLSSSDSTTYHIFGQLCSQGSIDGKTVQFLIHGLTYDHTYWDWPMSPEKYSYVRKATHEGYATFTIDRIGIGNSDHPLSTLVTTESNAFVVHQLIQDLRNGTVGGVSFSKIVLVGHSFGSAVSLYEQATYADADGLILSGFTHQFNPDFLPIAFSDTYPASLDPKFAQSNFPGTYLTSVPNTRGSLYYNSPDADPNVIALDEQLKQTATDGEFSTLFDAFAPNLSQSIHVPVLIALGQNDFLFCNPSAGLSCQNASAIIAREQADFSPHACLEAYVLPNSGHVMNLHLNAHQWFESANDWVTRRIGTSTNTPPTQPCL